MLFAVHKDYYMFECSFSFFSMYVCMLSVVDFNSILSLILILNTTKYEDISQQLPSCLLEKFFWFVTSMMAASDCGRVKCFDLNRGYGFLFNDDNKTELFFHKSDVVQAKDDVRILKYLQPGSRVKFGICKDPKEPNKFKATHVTQIVTFLREDGSAECQDVVWCLGNGYIEICNEYWTGPWYHAKRHCCDINAIVDKGEGDKVKYAPVPSNYTCFLCKSTGDHWIMQCPFRKEEKICATGNICKASEWITEDGIDSETESEEYGYNGIPQLMCGELLRRGMKPWDSKV